MSKYLVAYSAVLDGQGNPFGSAEDHERGVEGILQTLMGSKTGKAVFKKIIAHGVVRIKPYDASLRPEYGSCNALAFGEIHREKVASGITRPAVNVEFSPDTFAPNNGCIFGAGFHPDEVLLHELVHSMRNLGGEARHLPFTDEMAYMKNETEYFAVLVTNIYISEMGRQPISWLVGTQGGSANTGLRMNYVSQKVDDDQALSVDFLMFGQNYRLVKKFCEQHPNVSRWLGEVEARFNPIKVFQRWEKVGVKPAPPPPGQFKSTALARK